MVYQTLRADNYCAQLLVRESASGFIPKKRKSLRRGRIIQDRLQKNKWAGRPPRKTHNPEIDDLFVKTGVTSFIEFFGHEIGTIFKPDALTFQSASIEPTLV